MILTIGDSVSWGQGLKEEHKYDFLFAESKGSMLTRLAHSGAVIGTPTDSSTEVEDGEIPIASPSLWQQVQSPIDWPQVSIVLLNGGINDVGLARILSPWSTDDQLARWVDQFCDQGLRELLTFTVGKMTLPNSRVVVTGYYPILSGKSGGTETQVKSLLEIHGVATSSVITDKFAFIDVFPKIVDNCLTFWNHSNQAFQSAVDAVNAMLGTDICSFVQLPFAEENAMWAPASLLWELTALLLPEDEVSGPRGHACEVLYGDLVEIPQWIQCVRASAGHPKVEGAAKIASALSAAGL